MKIPYIKIYAADLLAKSRHLSAEQIGRLVISACEQAFEGNSENTFSDPKEQAFYEMLNEWILESQNALKQKKIAGRRGGRTTQQKNKLLDGSTACLSASSRKCSPALELCLKHTETNTETEINIKKLNKKSESETQTPTLDLFEDFWQAYPKQRIGNKDKTRLSFKTAISRTNTPAEQIVAKAREYAQSAEVAQGFAKGAQAWLNDDRYLQTYLPYKTPLEKAREEGMRIIDEMFGGKG